jgi:hypothetical protein
MAANFGRRFEELSEQANAIEASKKWEHSSISPGNRIDPNDLVNWKVRVRHLLASVCGEDSQHYKLFVESEASHMYETNYEIFGFWLYERSRRNRGGRP